MKATLAVLGLLLSACAVREPADSPASTTQEVQSCKKSCDKMKFFDCNSASEMARCYDDCGQASSRQIELFVACADNSICDPECRTQIAPAPNDDPGTGNAGGGGGGTVGGGGGGGSGGLAIEDCQVQCDDLSFFSCVSAAEHATCRDLCASVAGAKRDSFTGCVRGTVDCPHGRDCYGELAR